MSTAIVRLPALAVCLCAAALLGCGGVSDRAAVSGTVTLHGKPPGLEGLQLSFMGKDGRPVMAVVGPSGAYRAGAVALGEVQVAVFYTSPEAWQAAAARDARARPPSTEASRSPVPARYQDPRTSRLTLVVEAGKENRFDVDIRP
jgi:hypothetical protein